MYGPLEPLFEQISGSTFLEIAPPSLYFIPGGTSDESHPHGKHHHD